MENKQIPDDNIDEKLTFKDLSFWGKIEHIWEYYRLIIIGSILIVAFVVSLTVSIVRNNYETVCYVAVLDGKITGYADDTDALSTGFSDYLGIDGKKQRIDLAYSYSLVEREMDEEAAVSANKIYTYASTGSMDGYLSEREYIDYFCTDREVFFCDLRDIFSEEELKQLEDYIVYFTDSKGNTTPIAVAIKDAPVIKDSDLNMKDPCYGVISTSKYYENSANFIRFVFQMDKR